MLFGLGTATIDLRIGTADFGPEYRAKLLARTTRMLGGGAAANALHQAALLGASTEWLGRLGRDTIGRIILEDLKAARVGTSRVVAVDGALSPFNLAVYAGPANRRVGGFLLPNCLADVTQSDMDLWAAAPKGGDWCLVEAGEIPLPIVLEFCTRVRRSGVHVLLDIDLDPVAQCVGGSRRLVEDLMRSADYVLPNRDAMAGLYPGLDAKELTEAIRRDCGRPVVTTAGSDGCYCAAAEGSIVHVEAPTVEVVDTVGAGDAFHGAFAWALMDGQTFVEAVHAGSLCGAANCTAFGARAGMLDRRGYEEFRKRAGA
jgi:sulfofructose kinase